MTAPARSCYRGARVVTSLRNLAAKVRAEGAPRPLTLEQMLEAVVVKDRDPYRDWRSAYEADIRRGGAGGNGSRVIRTGAFASNRTAVPRPYKRERQYQFVLRETNNQKEKKQ